MMYIRFISFLCIVIIVSSCSKDEISYKPSEKANPYTLYKEGMEAFDRNDFFFANKKFLEAERNFEKIELSAKVAIMSCFSLYGINFYEEAEQNLRRFLKTYPSDKNTIYANYLIAIIYYEQISDEKDLDPLLKASKEIDIFVKKYPNTDYAIDLKFKKNLINNQIATKELFVAKYYIKTQKWVPAINRLKIIIDKYDETRFVEEALHRLVEIHYYLGLEEEAKKYAQILGYNYNSSEWFEQSYKILNKDYKIKKSPKKNIENDKTFLKKIIEMIR